MKTKLILPVFLIFLSSGVHAIPPLPPEIIDSEISLENESACHSSMVSLVKLLLSPLQSVKLEILQSENSEMNTLYIIGDDGNVIESFPIACN